MNFRILVNDLLLYADSYKIYAQELQFEELLP